ncbi:conserved hypothetical protein [Aliivibrio fischeri MJ11]|uniref:SPOR domain-containing protein n=1 Tax=Aliivibrio fischeri (strain MJ11) TaxID=388396 RepID=B5FBN0_ALIFM|nr:SPOR domain-containing protein [Aliivibrio fischeri]ACH65905.1 conserved hypothetical protein [Aliivibrio fischeri MJ11]
MSIGHDLTVLELESQIDVLSRIQFVSRFGSNLVHIEGAKGSGKSWLAQRYLEKWCDDADQVLLMCHPNQSIQQQRGIILKQVVRDPLFNESDSVVDSVGRMLAGEKCNLVLAIDDAHLLSSELLSELWLLVQKAQSAPNWQINILLFAEKGKLTQTLSQMSYGQDNKPVDIDINPLTEEEAVTFAEMLVVRFAVDKDEKSRLRTLARKCNRLPAELVALGEKKTERRVIIRSVTRSPVGILGLASVLLLGSAGAYWWLNQSSTMPISSIVDNTLEQDTRVALDLDGNPTSIDTEVDKTNQPEDDTDSIPPDVIDTPIIADTKEEIGKRVVVPSELVDSLVTEDKEVQEKPTLDVEPVQPEEKPPVEKAPTATQEKADKPKTTSESKKKDEKTSVSTVTPDKADSKITFTLADKELKAISNKRYILQLAALTNEEAVQEFLDDHKIEGSARIYQALRNGSIWYIVSYGDYESISSARGAVKTLPASVQSLGPWAKSLVQVHREIDSVK